MRLALCSMVGVMALLACLGCGANPNAPNYLGRVVSFSGKFDSDSYSSAMITSANGSVTHGYEDPGPPKTSWSSDIRWTFLRHDKDHDVYRIEWTFQANNGTPVSGNKEVAFDGSHAVHVTNNGDLQFLSIEPGLF